MIARDVAARRGLAGLNRQRLQHAIILTVTLIAAGSKVDAPQVSVPQATTLLRRQ